MNGFLSIDYSTPGSSLQREPASCVALTNDKASTKRRRRLLPTAIAVGPQIGHRCRVGRSKQHRILGLDSEIQVARAVKCVGQGVEIAASMQEVGERLDGFRGAFACVHFDQLPSGPERSPANCPPAFR